MDGKRNKPKAEQQTSAKYIGNSSSEIKRIEIKIKYMTVVTRIANITVMMIVTAVVVAMIMIITWIASQ